MATKNLFLQTPSAGDIQDIYEQGAQRLSLPSFPGTTEPASPAPAPAPAATPAPGASTANRPLPTREDIVRRATELGIDPAVPLAIWGIESGSNFNSRDSYKGAVGGMQVMPGTYKQMMGTSEGMRDPWNNMEAGLRYIAYGQNTLGTKDPALLAAGYHAGYGRPELKRGEIPNTSDGLMNTRDYAASVARKVGLGGASSNDLQSRLDAEEPGRYRVLTPDQARRFELQAQLDAEEPGRYKVLTDEDLKALEPSALASAEDEDNTEVGFWERLPQVAQTGWGNMTRALDVSRSVLSDDFSPQTVDLIAGSIEQQIKQAQADKGRQHASEKELKDAIEKFGKTEGVVDTTLGAFSLLGSVFANPKGVAIGSVEQLANMLPSIGGAFGGAAAGAGVGAAAGSVVPGAGTAVGATAGALWGSRAGLAAGTAALEFGNEITEAITSRLEEQKKEPTRENIAALLADPKMQSEIKTQAAKKGLTLAAVDALTMGLAGKVGSSAVEAGRAGRRGQAVRRGAGAVGIEAAGEPIGEAASQLVARGEIDKADVAAEAIYGVPASVGGAAIGTGFQAARDRATGGATPAAPTDTAPQTPTPQSPAPNGPITRAMEKAAGGAAPEAETQTVTRTDSDGNVAVTWQEEAPVNQPRVRITAANGETMTGVAEELGQDGSARVIGDDGQTYVIGPDDGVTIEAIAEEAPAAAPAVPDPALPQEEAQNVPEPDGTRSDRPADGNEPADGSGAGADRPVPGSGLSDAAVPGEQATEPVPAASGPADRQPALSDERVVRTDGKPFKTESAARQAAKNRRLPDHVPVQVDGGWALTPQAAQTERPAPAPTGDPLIDNPASWVIRNKETGEVIGETFERAQVDALNTEKYEAVPAAQHLREINDPQSRAGRVARGETAQPSASQRKPKQPAMPRQDFDSTAGVGKISAVKERNGERFGVSWGSTNITDAATMEEAADIAKAIAESGADNIADMRAVASRLYNERVASEQELIGLRQRESNGEIASTKGTPFKTKAAAQKALNELPEDGEFARGDFGLYERDGGFVLRRFARDGRGVGAVDPNWVDQDRAQQAREEARQAFMRERGLVEDKFGNMVTPEEAERNNAEPDEDADTAAQSPEQAPKAARQMQPSEEGRPVDGKPIMPGDRFRTQSGRETTPYPKGKDANNLLADRWLAENALAEAEARGDDFNAPVFRRMVEGLAPTKKADRVSVSTADRDSMNLYLWSEQPDVVPSILRPLATSNQTTVKEESPAAPTSSRQAPRTSNKIFTDEAAEKARALLRSKLNQLNSGIDPEVMQAGITLAGWHIEKGARAFADFARSMIEDMGEGVRPYLKSWYLGAKFDPRSSALEGMSTAAEVESFDLDGAQADAQPASPAPADATDTEVVVTPEGREIEVRYKVVEGDTLVPSNLDDGRVNPDYPQALQPRNRSKAASELQITNIASRMNPRLLGESASTTDGAPIVSAEGVVESGNGRTMAILRAYRRGLDSAQGYRDWLASQGYDVAGMKAPVLVRERVTPLTQAELVEYTRESNARTTMQMAPEEQARADADHMAGIIDLYVTGDIGNAANRPFVRAFIDEVVPQSEQGDMVTDGGALSIRGRKRIEAALMHAAYGDERLVADLFVDPSAEIKTIGGAMLDAAAQWLKMRTNADPSLDVTPQLVGAVNIVRRAREEDKSIYDMATQIDVFSGATDPVTMDFLSMFFRGDRFNRQRSREAIGDMLYGYAAGAEKIQPGPDMFGAAPPSAQEILRTINEKRQRDEGAGAGQGSFFDSRPPADDGGATGRGGAGQGPGAQAQDASPQESGGPVNAPSPNESVERDRQDAAAGEPVVPETDGDAAGPNAGDAGVAGQRADGAQGAGRGDQRVPADRAAPGRKRGHKPVHRADGQFQPSGRPAGSAERTGSGSDSGTGSQVEQQREEAVANDAHAPGADDLPQRLAAQRKAKNAPTKWGNKASIDAALPLLLPEQRDDVLKAEQRFAGHNGILYTNGTGTGKTATGLGVAKRFINDGKTNILIVVPSDKIASDWVKFAGMLNINLKQLADTTDNGKSGPVVTTYANFGQNESLAQRDWDLVITDESHYLSSNEAGDKTAALNQLRALTGHHDGFFHWVRQRFPKEWKEYSDANQARSDANGNPDIGPDRYAQLEAAANRALAKWQPIEDRERAKWNERWVKQEGLPKTVMLSATPFAYAKNTDYAEGYLFHYTEPGELAREGGRVGGYNSGSARDRFMMQHFGYRMRYNKLTAPEAGVNSQLMEQQFNEWLKQNGALSGRRLEVPFDYDRKFVLVDDAVGAKIDKGLEYLREAEDGRYRPVYDAVMSQFDYHRRMYLLESMKARAAVPIIRQHLQAGRKVVVFHDFNKGGGFDPFKGALRDITDQDLKDLARSVLSQPMFQLDFSGLNSPIVTMQQAFPDALFFNGTVSKGQRRANADLFNDDDSGRNLIVVQSDAGREGVSLHDTTGKHQRVEINLGMPVKPVAATQIEGRIYRTGQASDAVFRYLTTGTAWEAGAFASKIAERASTAENLALGGEARGLKEAFIDAYLNAGEFPASAEDGKGGKAYDRQLSAALTASPFERAKTFYWAQAKNTKRRDQREGRDYFATPEPVGFKMVEFAGILPNDKALEPSAGHGAIARFFPEQADVTMVEPSYELSQRAGLANGNARIVNDTFESLHINNKFDAIVMNPPYGSGGKTSTEHLAKAAKHLRNGGRIVALLPRGGLADQRLAAFRESDEAADLYGVARIDLPPVTFERAGTKVNTQILILEKHTNPEDAASINERWIDLSGAESINELFDRIENVDLPARQAPSTPEPRQEIVEHITAKGKRLRGIIRTDLTKEEAQEIDRYTFRKKNAQGDTGWFIRAKHLDDAPKFSIQEEERYDAGLPARAPVSTRSADLASREAQGRYSVGGDGRMSAEFGPIFDEHKNDPAGAIRRLMQAQEGEAVAAVTREGIGEISLVYGDADMGLAHIARQRGEAWLDRLPAVLQNGTIYSKRDQRDRVYIGTPGEEAVVRLDYDKAAKTWLVTAYTRSAKNRAVGESLWVQEEGGGAAGSTNDDSVSQGSRSPNPDRRTTTVTQLGGNRNDTNNVIGSDEIRNTLQRGDIGALARALIDAGRVVLHDTVATVPVRNMPAGVQAVTAPDGTIHMVADALTPARARPVLLHEAFHQGGEKLIGSKAWSDLLKRLGSIHRQARQSSGRAREFYDAARQSVDRAQRAGARMNEDITAEEFGAYTIEHYDQAPAAFRKWVDDVIGALKAWVLRRFGIQAGDVTPAQLRSLAVEALRAEAQPAESSRFSMAPPTNTPAFRRWFGNSQVVDENGDPLAVYHGSPVRDFNIFDISKVNANDPDAPYNGFWFSSDKDSAETAGSFPWGRPNTPDGGQVRPFYLSIKNPIARRDALRVAREIRDDFETRWPEARSLQDATRLELEKRGYDGIVHSAPVRVTQDLVSQIDAANGEPVKIGKGSYAVARENDGTYGLYSDSSGYIMGGYDTAAEAIQEVAEEVYIAFRPEQIKSAISNRGTFDGTNPDIRYSVKPSEHFKDLTDRQKSFLDKIGPERLPQRLADRWRQLTDNLGLRIRQAGVDRYASLLRNDQALYGEDTLEGSIASSAWVLARMSHAAGGALSAMLNHGRIYLDPKEKVIDIREGTTGLRGMFQQLGTPQEIDRFMAWVAANRARQLKAQGRENLFTSDEIEAGINLSAGRMENGDNRGMTYAKAWKEFQQFRDDVLRIAEQAGTISKEQRELWSEEFYVPFYRVLDEDTIGGPSMSSGLSRQQAYKRLKGGKQNLNDLLENTLLNFHHLIQSALKNQAASQAIENALELGIAEPTTESNRNKKASTFVMQEGEKRWYDITDPLTFKALSALNSTGLNTPLMKVGRAFKRLFTNMTTITPQFMIANTLRDSLSAMATSPTSAVPFKNAVKGAAIYGNDQNRARMLASGASFSFGHIYGQNPDEIKASLRGTLRNARVLTNPSLVPGVLIGAWRKWNRVTDFAENVNRAGIWERNLERGKLKAAFEARDLMDFSAHGEALTVRILTDLVPFLNARIQGLDKLYRSGFKPGGKVLFGKGSKADKQAFARFGAVVGALSVLSMLLYLNNKDDEEFRKLEDWQRDTYWFIRVGEAAFFIPKPFEVGAIATLAERGLEQFMDPTVAGKKFAERLGHMLTDTFSLDLPQIIKPAYELSANRNTFTGRPIENLGMQRLSPSLRVNPNTSRLAEGASRAMEAVAGDSALSPLQIDHLIGAYLGQVGAGTVALSDVFWRRAMGEDLPARRWSEYQPIRRFYRDLGAPSPYTRYSTDFYNALKEADKAYANVQHLLKYQEFDRADALMEKEADKLDQRRWLNKVQRDLSKINAEMRQIQIDKDMDAEQKRFELDRLRELRNMITEDVGKELEQERVRKRAQ